MTEKTKSLIRVFNPKITKILSASIIMINQNMFIPN